MEKGVLVGDAATRMKQTMMFDLPVVTKGEVQDLLKADCRRWQARCAINNLCPKDGMLVVDESRTAIVQ